MTPLATFKDIPPKRFHSAILTTYSIDLYFVEEIVRRILHSKGISNILILVDQKMLDYQLSHLSKNLRFIGKQYSVIGIPSSGAFHPKINLFVGEEGALINIGSGNLTIAGHGGNHESWGTAYVHKLDDPLLPLFYQTWDFLCKFTQSKPGVLKNQLDWMTAHCSLLKNRKPNADSPQGWLHLKNGYRLSFIPASGTQPFRRIKDLIPNEDIEKITLTAPYFDPKGLWLKQLATAFPNASIQVVLQDNHCLPPQRMSRDPRIQFFSWEENVVSEKLATKASHRQHSKMIEWEGTADTYLYLGSANCSIAAWGDGSAVPNNQEAGWLLHREKGSFLKDLGIQVKGDPKDLDSFEPLIPLETSSEKKYTGFEFSLTAAEAMHRFLFLYWQGTLPTEVLQIHCFDHWNQQIGIIDHHFDNQQPNKLAVPKSISLDNLLFIQLFEDEKIASPKIPVHFSEEVYKMHPSKKNRALNRLVASLESELSNAADILDYLNTLESNQSSHKMSSKNLVAEKSRATSNESEVDYQHFTYEEFSALVRKKPNLLHHTFNKYHSLRVLDALMYARDQKERKKNDLEIDDEEITANLSGTVGRAEEEEVAENCLSSRSFIKLERQLRKMLEKYWWTLEKNVWEEDPCPVTLVDLSMFLLILYLMIDFTDREFLVEYKEKDDRGNNVSYQEREVLFPRNGSYEESNFRSWVYALIGLFTLQFSKAGEYLIPSDEYSKGKLDHYKQRAFIQSIFAITLIEQSTRNVNIKEKDNLLLPLYLNVRKAFLVKNIQFPFLRENLEKESLHCHIEMYSVDQAIEVIKEFEHFYQQNKNSMEIPIEGEFFHTLNLGYCEVIKAIPSIEQPKFLKIRRPGFPGEEGEATPDFILEKLYQVKGGKLIPRLQSLNDYD